MMKNRRFKEDYTFFEYLYNYIFVAVVVFFTLAEPVHEQSFLPAELQSRRLSMCLQTRLQRGILRKRSVFITVFRFSPGSGIFLAYSTDINSFQMCVYIYTYIYIHIYIYINSMRGKKDVTEKLHGNHIWQ